MDNCVVFTIKSDYARFKKYELATSALTYLIIHPLAVKGLVGRLMGLGKGKLGRFGRDIKVGIQVLAPIQKEIKQNLIAEMEYLKNPCFKLFILSNNKLKLQLLINNLTEAKYSEINLGCQECPAEIEFEGIRSAGILPPGMHQVSSIIPVNCFKLHWDKDGMGIHLENLPVKSYLNKEFLEFQQVFYRCDEIILKGVVLEEIYQVGNENIYFF